jgi:nucleoside-diphosphate-sugar epimerase
MTETIERRVFLAGAGGVIGRRLCPLLIEDGWEVTGSTRSPQRAKSLRAAGVHPVIVDVFDAASLQQAVAETRPSVIVHQLTDLPSSLDPAKIDEAAMLEASRRNARIREIGTRHLLAAGIAAGVRRLIAQSIAFAYAPGPEPHREDDPLNVEGPGRAGVSARGVASLEDQVMKAPLEGIVLRFGRLYGLGTGVEAPAGKGIVHVDAAADATRRAMRRGAPGIYNVAESDGAVDSRKAIEMLGWSPGFRGR